MLLAVAVAGCTSAPTVPTYPEIRFSGKPPMLLDVARVDIVEAYRPPLRAPNVDHLFGAYIDYLTAGCRARIGAGDAVASRRAWKPPRLPPVMVGEGRPSTICFSFPAPQKLVDGRPSPTMTGRNGPPGPECAPALPGTPVSPAPVK